MSEASGMKKQRLLKLAALLEEDAGNPKGMKFDLGYWAAPANLGDSDLSKKDFSVDCGTVGCAVGLACLSGAFRRRQRKGKRAELAVAKRIREFVAAA